mmetsp:Transcript_4365/g.10546  ORF Transcript_4365/g.10546 Transcript_4365/m.10546 type:complete len:206 (-) Transcript_4365:599-1216(-)
MVAVFGGDRRLTVRRECEAVILHYRSEFELVAGVCIIVDLEIVFLTALDVLPMDRHVAFPIWPRVLVRHAQGVGDLVDCDSKRHAPGHCQLQLLSLPASFADEGPTTIPLERLDEERLGHIALDHAHPTCGGWQGSSALGVAHLVELHAWQRLHDLQGCPLEEEPNLLADIRGETIWDRSPVPRSACCDVAAGLVLADSDAGLHE